MRQALFATLLAPLVLAATPVLAADLPLPLSAARGLLFANAGRQLGRFLCRHQRRRWLWLLHRRRRYAARHPTGGLVGFTPGYNHMVAPNLLIGLESDFDFTGLTCRRFPISASPPRAASTTCYGPRARRLRHGPRLVYITAGFAGSNNTLTVSNVWGGRFYGQQSIFQTGWALAPASNSC